MSKIIVMGDTHGRSFWKQVVNIQEFDKIILLGDYFDSFDIGGEEQIKNFLDIMAYKAKNPKKMICLFGNHDFHYMPVAQAMGERYSGYQPKYAHTISLLLQEHKFLMQMAHQEDKYLFTHAGVTHTWFEKWTDDLEGEVVEKLNDLYNFKPQAFLFDGIDSHGDDITQSPIWVRPQSLNQDALAYIHVVGHTSMKRILSEPVKFKNDGYGIFADTLGVGEYLIIEDDKLLTGRC